MGWLATAAPALLVWLGAMMPFWGAESRKAKAAWSIGLLVLGLASSSFVYFYQRPNISIQAGNTTPFLVASDGWIFARVRIKNESLTQDAFCRLFLTGLLREDQSIPILENENISLAVANQDTDRFVEQTIGPGFGMLFDVAFSIPTEKQNLKIPARERGSETQFSTIVKAPLLAGVYKLTIQANGKNCVSQPREIRVNFSDFPNLSIIP